MAVLGKGRGEVLAQLLQDWQETRICEHFNNEVGNQTAPAPGSQVGTQRIPPPTPSLPHLLPAAPEAHSIKLVLIHSLGGFQQLVSFIRFFLQCCPF